MLPLCPREGLSNHQDVVWHLASEVSTQNFNEIKCPPCTAISDAPLLAITHFLLANKLKASVKMDFSIFFFIYPTTPLFESLHFLTERTWDSQVTYFHLSKVVARGVKRKQKGGGTHMCVSTCLTFGESVLLGLVTAQLPHFQIVPQVIHCDFLLKNHWHCIFQAQFNMHA